MGKQKYWAAPLLLVTAASTASAAETAADWVRQCTQLKDSLERLVCYDRIFLAPATVEMAPRQVAPPPAAVPAPAPAAVAPPVVIAPPPPPPVVSNPAPQPAPATVPAPAPTRPAVQETPNLIEANITALKELRREVYLFTLDNGQIWQQNEAVGVLNVRVGDALVIKKGALGGYMAELKKGSPRIRVARLK
jgi:hypothetical protein